MQNFPQAFVDRIEKIVPPAERADFLAMATEPLPKVVRVRVPELTEKQDWQLRPTLIPNSFFIDRTDKAERPLGKTLEHFTGQIYSQSLSSMLPVQVLDPQPEEKILDMCAAPGSKTTFCADRMKNTGLLVANEPSGTRSKKLVSNLNRLGVTNTVLLQSDGTILDHFLAPLFDKVLLDAPCSSEGFGRRDAKFFSTMWSAEAITEMSKLQRRLIVSGFNLLQPGGTMTYSTCTSAPEENECVVQHLCDTFPGAVEILPIDMPDLPHSSGLEMWEDQAFDSAIQQHAKRLYPHLRSDTWNSESFFVCKIKKLAPTPPIKRKPITQPTGHKFFKKNTQLELATRLRKNFGLPKDWLGKGVFMEKNGAVYLTTKAATSFCNNYLWRRTGLPLLDKDGNITTAFALKFGPLATKNVVSLNLEDTKRWLAGYDISALDLTDKAGHNQFLVMHQGYSLGWGKVVRGKLKNKLDRELVFDY